MNTHCCVAAAKGAPQLSALSQLLNTDQSELPGMIRQLLDPLAAPFSMPAPLSALPIGANGTPQWRYNGQALLEYHLKQARSAPQGQVLRTAGLLGQPQADTGCPVAPSLTRSQVRQSSRHKPRTAEAVLD